MEEGPERGAEPDLEVGSAAGVWSGAFGCSVESDCLAERGSDCLAEREPFRAAADLWAGARGSGVPWERRLAARGNRSPPNPAEPAPASPARPLCNGRVPGVTVCSEAEARALGGADSARAVASFAPEAEG